MNKLKAVKETIVLVQPKKYFGKNYYYPFCEISEMLSMVIGTSTLVDRHLLWLSGLNYKFYEFDTGKRIVPVPSTGKTKND